MLVIDIYRAGKFVQSLNPVASAKQARHVVDGWLRAGYAAKMRTVTPLPAVAPNAFFSSVPFDDLEGYVRR